MIEHPEDPGGWFTGQKVEVIGGPFKGYTGKIYSIDRNRRVVRIYISLLIGTQERETPVELRFGQIKAVQP